MKRYALFPGCFISARLPHLEAVCLKVFGDLGVGIERLKGATCCPEPVTFRLLNLKAWYAIAARNLCLAEEVQLDILTLCNGCNATLSVTNRELKTHKSLRIEVNEYLKIVGKRFRGQVDVKSIVRALYEDIGLDVMRRHLRRSLKRLRVALHHGCHSLDDAEHFKTSEQRALEELVKVLGADIVSYPSEMLCCGAFARSVDKELSLNVAQEKLADLANINVDCLVVTCPYCFLQYELAQTHPSWKSIMRFEIPILYYHQLLGLGMGFDAREIGLNYHKIKATKLVRLLNAS